MTADERISATHRGRLSLSRRGLLVAGGAMSLGLAGLPITMSRAGAQPAAERLVIDLATEPGSLDPATTYDADGWSIIHSIYDSLLQYGENGELEPLLAESFELVDPLTYRVILRDGIVFHNGEILNSEAIAFSLAHIIDEATGSQVAGNFAVIERVEIVDDLTADLKLTAPAPWLPAQIAAWFVMLPPVYASENDFVANPVGTGPYKYSSRAPGDRIALTAYEDYFRGSPKGQPVARDVDFRFVADATTRVADLLSGTADVVRNVPVDQIAAIESNGDRVVQIPISGAAFVRIPTDIEPFNNPLVRQAMNYAVDVQSIVDALLSGNGVPLANVFVPNGLGYVSNLEPYPFDPERARALLEEAGFPDGFETSLDATVTDRTDIVDAIAGQLTEVGIRTTVNRLELALFNSGDYWLGTDSAAAPLRFLTWRPLFDPHTLLSLVFSNTGFLSRHDNPTIQALIDAFAVEADPATRSEIGQALGLAMHEEPAAIYLYSLTSLIGARAGTPEWDARADDYLIAASQ